MPDKTVDIKNINIIFFVQNQHNINQPTHETITNRTICHPRMKPFIIYHHNHTTNHNHDHHHHSHSHGIQPE